ncbi:MAG: methyl-accepting chemotaxis protein [bacterium]
MKFKTKITIANSLITVIAVAIIYYIAINTIDFTPDIIKFISIVTVFIVIAALVIQYIGSKKPFSIIGEFENRQKNNTIDSKFSKTAFYTAVYFPIYFTTLSAAQWYFASVIYFILLYAFSNAGLITALKTMFAIVSGATVANIFQYFIYQRLTEPITGKIQEYLKEEDINIKRRMGIFTKMFVSATLLILIFLIFARIIGIQLMDNYLRRNGVLSAKLDLASISFDVNSILSQNLSPEQIKLELSKIKLGKNGFILVADDTFNDIFNISDNYSFNPPLNKLSKTDEYNDPYLGITLLKNPLNNDMYLIGVYSWSDYNDTLLKFIDALNWLILAIIIALLIISLEATIDIYLPVRAISLAVERLTQGNFSTSTGLFVEDEIGIVANSIRKTTDGIKSIIKTIKTVSSNITGSSNKITISVEQIKENITILGKGIENNMNMVTSVQKKLGEFANYIEGFINSVNDTTINSDKLLELIHANKDILTNLNNLISSTVQSNENLLITTNAIKTDIEKKLSNVSTGNYDYLKTFDYKIADSVRALNIGIESIVDNINRLKTEVETEKAIKQNLEIIFRNSFSTVSVLSDNVEKIVVDLNKIELVIDDTNLLAMNSSVISAQAGKAGRGFDVISDEITKLASVTQTKILEVKNLADLLVREKDTLKGNMDAKEKLVEKINNKMNAIEDVINDITRQIIHAKELFEQVTKNISSLTQTSETLLTADTTKKEMYHSINAKIIYVEKSIEHIDKYTKETRDTINNLIQKWKDYSEIVFKISKELSEISSPINTMIGYMNVIKTKTAEIHGLFGKIIDASKQLDKQLISLDLKDQIENIATKINEEPKRYRVI